MELPESVVPVEEDTTVPTDGASVVTTAEAQTPPAEPDEREGTLRPADFSPHP
ncbi:hypothetical protein ABH925_004215 [Streptacidiphilus sp. EB129]|jgi:hypothetical protein